MAFEPTSGAATNHRKGEPGIEPNRGADELSHTGREAYPLTRRLIDEVPLLHDPFMQFAEIKSHLGTSPLHATADLLRPL